MAVELELEGWGCRNHMLLHLVDLQEQGSLSFPAARLDQHEQ